MALQKFHIDLDNKPLWYMKDVHPLGKVPAVRARPGEPVVIESLAINEFLVAAYDKDGTSGLLPSDPIARAAVTAWIEHAEKILNPVFYAVLKENAHPDSAWATFTGSAKAAHKAARQDLTVALAYYERNMVGPFLTGGTFTLADIATFPAFERLAITLPHFLKWDALEPCPRLRAWIAATRARPSVNATLQVQDKEQKLLAVSVFLRAHK